MNAPIIEADIYRLTMLRPSAMSLEDSEIVFYNAVLIHEASICGAYGNLLYADVPEASVISFVAYLEAYGFQRM